MPTRTGLTLLELLAALVLASLLLMAVLGVTGGLAKQQRLLREQSLEAPWQRQLVAQLEWDFLQARRVRWSDQRLTLMGYAGCDPLTGQPLHRPTQVDYYLGEIEGQTWLVRRQALLDETSLTPPTPELVCLGVSRLELQPLVSLSGGSAASWNEVPLRFHFILTGEEAESVVWEHTFYLR